MKFEKLTDAERAQWADLSDLEYEDEPIPGIEEDDKWLLCRILSAAVCDDFDWLLRIAANNSADIDRCKLNPVFRKYLMRAYEHGVASGSAGCCCNLGNMFHQLREGEGDEDISLAISLYEMGADLGDAQASVNLGYFCCYGRGMAVDYTRAYECYARAALAEGNPEALWKLGDLYAGGRGVRQSDWMAWLMYSKAYENGKGNVFAGRAAHHVADCLMAGIEGKLEKDPERALKLYVEAELGYYEAIDAGLRYYTKCLHQAIEGQALAREAIRELHEKRRA